MVSFSWMCSLSFGLYEQIWLVLKVLLHSLHLLIMSHDCPFGNPSQKGGVYVHGDRGSFVLEYIDCT